MLPKIVNSTSSNKTCEDFALGIRGQCCKLFSRGLHAGLKDVTVYILSVVSIKGMASG